VGEGLIDAIIAAEFASPDLELHWLDEDDADAGKSEATLEARLKIGAVTLNEVRSHLGLDPYTNPAADRPMVLTATGYVPIEANAGGADAPPGANPEERPQANLSAAETIENRRADAAAVNADQSKSVQKAAADDPAHPGWPAGTPGGLGGKFRPKDSERTGTQNGSNSAATDEPKVVAFDRQGMQGEGDSAQRWSHGGGQWPGYNTVAYHLDQVTASDAPAPIPVVDFSGGFHEVVVNAWMEYFQRSRIPAVKEPSIRLIGQTAVVGFPDIMVLLPGFGLATLEIKTGEDPPLTDNQMIYLPMLQLGGHLYSTDERIGVLGLAPGMPFPPMPVFVIFANPGQQYRAIELPPPHPKP
jgi:hypothetical protein